MVHYRSRVVFRIGSICLPHSRAISDARYSGFVTWSCSLHIRDFHPLWCAVPGDFCFMNLDERRSIPHISPRFPKEIQFVLLRVHSPLLTESLLISFPPPTKMLQFGGFPIAFAIDAGASGSPIRPSADPWYTCTSPQLIAACHDLHRHSSRAIPQLGCSITCMLSHTMRVTLRYLIHANSASTENRLLRDGSPLPFPRHMAC